MKIFIEIENKEEKPSKQSHYAFHSARDYEKLQNSRCNTSSLLNPMNATVDEDDINQEWNKILGEIDDKSEIR